MSARLRRIALALLLAASVPMHAGGAGFAVERFSVSGGGLATGGSFALRGSVAQADADPLQPSNGGAYQLDGGYWGGAGQGDDLFRDGFE